MEKPCNCCVYKDDEFCSCENLSRYELYIDTYNQALEDVLNVVEWDGYTLDIKERIEQLKK